MRFVPSGILSKALLSISAIYIYIQSCYTLVSNNFVKYFKIFKFYNYSIFLRYLKNAIFHVLQVSYASL